jgi:hypothetical protein
VAQSKFKRSAIPNGPKVGSGGGCKVLIFDPPTKSWLDKIMLEQDLDPVDPAQPALSCYRLRRRKVRRDKQPCAPFSEYPQLFAPTRVSQSVMSKLIAFFVAAACTVACTTIAAGYSTEATMTRLKEKGSYEVIVRVSHLVEQDGKVVEKLFQRPRIMSSPGVPASLYCGPQPSDEDYMKRENVSVDVSWPEFGKQDFAVCAVVIKLGDKIVSKTKTRVSVEEAKPGSGAGLIIQPRKPVEGLVESNGLFRVNINSDLAEEVIPASDNSRPLSMKQALAIYEELTNAKLDVAEDVRQFSGMLQLPKETPPMTKRQVRILFEEVLREQAKVEVVYADQSRALVRYLEPVINFFLKKCLYIVKTSGH